MRSPAFGANGAQACDLEEVKTGHKALGSSVSSVGVCQGELCLSMPAFPGAILFPWAISGHAKPGSPFPKRKHQQVREVYWPPAQLPSRASIHLQPRLHAYVAVTAVMDFSYRAQDVLFSPLAKTPLGDIWQMASPAPGVTGSPARLLSSQCWRRSAEWQPKQWAPVAG